MPATLRRPAAILFALALLCAGAQARADDTDPDYVQIPPQVGVPLSTVIVSAAVVPGGYDAPAPISVSGGEYAIGCGLAEPFTTAPGTIVPGESVCVRHVSAKNVGTLQATTLTIGATEFFFYTTTTISGELLSLSPALLDFGNCQVGTTCPTRAVYVINAGKEARSLEVPTATGDFEIAVDACAGSVAANSSCFVGVAFKPTATGERGGVFTIVGGPTKASIPLAGMGIDLSDATPDAFDFPSQVVAAGTRVTSAPITPTGFWAPSMLTVAGGEYAIGCGGTFATASRLINPGESVCVRHVSSLAPLTATTTTLTIGGVAGTFTSTTDAVPPDTVPDPFAFPTQFGVQTVTLLTSAGITPSGLTALTSISIAGGEYAIGVCTGLQARYTSEAGTVLPGQRVCVRHRSAGTSTTATTTTLTIGGVSGTFTSITGVRGFDDGKPDPFSFVPQSGVPASSLRTSNAVTPVGFATPGLLVTVIDGEYSVGCNGTFTAEPGLLPAGQPVCVRHTAAATPLTETTTVLVAGLTSAAFTTTTEGVGDTTPDAFSFPSQGGVGRATPRTSAAIAITGIDTPAPFSVTGGEVSVNCTGAFVTAGSLVPGSSLCARHTSAADFGATATTTVTVGGVLGTFSSTTFAADGDADNDGIPNGVEYGESRNPEAKDNDIFANRRLFAMQQYRDFLGREGDAGGIQFYDDLLAAGPLTRGNVIENFFNSPEFGGTVSPIVRLYFATFRRIPDYDGLLFQVNAYRSGAPLAGIATNFTASPEFTTLYGNKTDAQYVALLYTNILGRTASPGEIDFHVARLQAGASRGDVLVGFSESPEYQQLTYNEVYVTMMYVGMLRRAPEQAGFDYWLDYMDTGNPGIALILGFLNAPEYRNRFLP